MSGKTPGRRRFIRDIGIAAAALSGSRLSLFGSCLSSLVTSALAGPQVHRNFIIINVDDLGWMDLSCYGSRYYETPCIDRLAAQGMKFIDAYAACAVCSPTRAAIMTGRYPARLGLTDWIHHLDRESLVAAGSQKNPVEYLKVPGKTLLCPPNPYWLELEEITIAEVLKEGGYRSGHIGKWHLGPDLWFPDKQGFDVNIGGCEIGQPPTYFDPYYQNPQRSSIPTLKPRKYGEYLTDRESDEAVRFISDHADKRFFLNMCHYAVHTPLQAREELIAKYRQKKPGKQKNPVYAAMVESVDRAVGRIMAVLDELKLTERTAVIFTSDNGGLQDISTDNAPLRAGKGYPYEGGIRVPLIIRWPEVVSSGSVCHVPVSSVDFFPTILHAAGIRLPLGKTIDGESLLPLLEQSGDLKRKAIFWHFPHYRGDVVPYSIVRRGDWKLIKRYEGRPYELFNLKEDLGEKTDLSSDRPETVRELAHLLEDWLKDTGAKIPREDPASNPVRE
jgi:arylsulfatase A